MQATSQVPQTKAPNFITDAATFLLAIFASWSITTDFSADQTYRDIILGNWNAIVATALPSLGTLIISVINKVKEKTFKFWVWVKDPNTITRGLILLAGLLTLINVNLPVEQLGSLADAITTGNIIAIIGALVALLGNQLWHWFKKTSS